MTIEPRSHRLAAHRIDLHYVDWGDPARPTVILVHGARDHARSWDRVAAALAPDWHVVAPDLRGHGDSGWSSDGATIPDHAADLAQLVAVIGKPQVRVVGHSFGGAIALYHAGCFPETVERIAAIEGLRPLYTAPEPTPELLRGWIERRLAERPVRTLATIAEAAARMRRTNPRLSEETALHLARHAVRAVAGGYRWKFDPAMELPPGHDLPIASLHALWAAIACPAWLVHGKESWATDPQGDGRAAHFRNAGVTSYEGAGHWVHHDRPDDFIADLRAFLA